MGGPKLEMEIFNMRLTRFTNYSLRVLIYLGQNNESRVTIQQISEAYGISKNHLMKVVSNLTRLKLVIAQRGPGGGIKLNRQPEEIGLDEVIGNTEKNLRDINLPGSIANTEASPESKLGYFLQHALQAYLTELSHFSLADVLGTETNLHQILELKRRVA